MELSPVVQLIGAIFAIVSTYLIIKWENKI